MLLGGKELTYFPLKPPFTPIKWKDGTPVSQRTNSPGAQCGEHSERTFTSSTPSALLNERTAISTHTVSVAKRNIMKEMRATFLELIIMAKVFLVMGKSATKDMAAV